MGLSRKGHDLAFMADLLIDAKSLKKKIELLNIKTLLANKDANQRCFLTVHSGAGGTEAQDWAGMLFRMYLLYCEAKSFKTSVLENSKGEIAGVKSATIKIRGDDAYGLLSGEAGIHRLVRKSPFNSNNKRQTSFASVLVYPVVDEKIAITINQGDLRIDTYRARGAGGQHVNTTDSAVRVTHIPTQIVVQCQNDRSQHKNKAAALELLRGRLYQLQRDTKNSDKNSLRQNKNSISWGRQIRSYILDKSLVKDLRSQRENNNPTAVLAGNLDDFIMTNLLANNPANDKEL